MSFPVFIVFQGRRKPATDDAYRKYAAGTTPLLERHGGRVATMGDGVVSRLVTEVWSTNAVLEFPTVTSAESFLSDPDYVPVKVLRDAAFSECRLSLVQSRAPRL